MNLKILQSTAAVVDGEPVALGRPMQRAVLVRLVAAEGRRLSVEQLKDQLWDGAPADTASQMLYRYVSALRHALHEPSRADRVVIPVCKGGYRAVIDRHEVDLFRFRDGVATARRAKDERERAALLRTALDEWGSDPTGLIGLTPLTGLPGQWISSLREELASELHDAIVNLAEAQLQLGEHGEFLPVLRALAVANGRSSRADERLHGVLMHTLYLSGHQMEATEVYHNLSRRLRDATGQSPDPTLQKLYQRILAQDPELSVPLRLKEQATAEPGTHITGTHANVFMASDITINHYSDQTRHNPLVWPERRSK